MAFCALEGHRWPSTNAKHRALVLLQESTCLVPRASSALQGSKETVVDTMMRVHSRGPTAWAAARKALERQRERLHERAVFCARLMAQWAAAMGAGSAAARKQKPQVALKRCYDSMTLDDWRK